MKYILLFVTGCFSTFLLYAQIDREIFNTDEAELKISSNTRLYGRLVDAATNKGIESASVQLIMVIKDTQTNATKDSVAAVMLSKPNGEFIFEKLPPADSFRLIISAIGYKLSSHDVLFKTNIGDYTAGSNMLQKDLGNIMLEQEIKSLGMVTVTAQKPALEMGIDKRIFNADQSLIAKGGTAIDLMKNIPAVSVDVDGNVELRNNTPQIFVDGRPTILTLEQIPAENVERVELITNPSAKYDAASTGGIINIILKKNKRVGMNGLASISAGHPKIFAGNVNLNLRQGKFNFFTSLNYNQSGGKAKSQSLRQNKNNGAIVNYFNQYSRNNRFNRFNSIRFGVDYFLDNRNTITVSENIVRGHFANDEQQDQEYLNSNKVLEQYGVRNAAGRFEYERYNTQINYMHKFPEAEKELNASLHYNSGNGKDRSSILNNYYYPGGAQYRAATNVRNEGWNNNRQATFQVDFADPVGDDSKIETGLRSYINNRLSIFNAFSLSNGIETKLPLSNNYEYTEMVNAFYFTYTGKWKSIGYQAGIRAEHSKFDGEMPDSARKFGYQYPEKISRIWDALFPSLYLSKALAEDEELQLNFSRRIRRPNFWQLNPFVDINDPVNIQRGNPELRPEYTNSFEFNYSKTFQDKSSFLASAYYRNNRGDITRFSDTITAQQYQQLNNAGIDPNAVLNTFINARSNNRLGAEFTLQKKFGPAFDITPTLELQYRKVNADFDDLNLSNEGFSWEAELIVNYKIENAKPSFFNKFGFQIIGQYESPEVIPQGKSLEQYSMDFAMRKDFLKNDKGTFTFSINDVFNSLRFGNIYDTEAFYQEGYRRRNVRSFRFTFSYKFGNADFSLFKRNENSRDEDE